MKNLIEGCRCAVVNIFANELLLKPNNISLFWSVVFFVIVGIACTSISSKSQK